MKKASQDQQISELLANILCGNYVRKKINLNNFRKKTSSAQNINSKK